MSKVTLTDNTDKYFFRVKNNLKLAMTDIKLSAVNTSRAAAPHKSGQLEKGITGEVIQSGSQYTVEVGAYAASKKGYNYAKPMELSNYKPSRPGTVSSVMSGNLRIGKGYLSKPIQSGYKNYIKHIERAIDKSNIE